MGIYQKVRSLLLLLLLSSIPLSADLPQESISELFRALDKRDGASESLPLSADLPQESISELFQALDKRDGASESFSRSQQRYLQSERDSSPAEHTEIKVACLSHLEPLEFIEDGRCEGYSADLLRLVSEKSGLKMTFKPFDDYLDIYTDLMMRDIDMMQLAPKFIGNRYDALLSDTYLDVDAVLVTQKSRDDLHDIDDIEGKRIALLEGSLTTQAVRLRYPMIEIVEYKETTRMLEAVAASEVDAMVSDFKIVNTMLQKQGFLQLKIAGRLEAFNIVSSLSFAIRSDTPVLKAMIDDALQEITEEEMNHLKQRWLKPSVGDKSTTKKESLMFSRTQKEYLQEKKRLTMCVPPDLPPFVIIEEGKLSGIVGDYMDYFEAMLGIPIEPVVGNSMEDSIHTAMDGGCDIHVMMPDALRLDDEALLKRPYLDDQMVMVTQVDEAFVSDLHVLSGKKIGVVQESVMRAIVEEEYPELEVVSVNSVESALKGVLRGELYAFLYPVSVLNYLIADEYTRRLHISGISDEKSQWSIAVRKSEPLLYAIFDEMLSNMTPETKNSIDSRWLFLKSEPGADNWLVWKVTIAIISLLLILLHWNRNRLLHRRELATKERALHDEKVRSDHSSEHDHLTGLANRSSFIKRFENSITVADSQDELLSLLFIDLDRFKIVNDTLGHHIGDVVLKVVANRLKDVITDIDFLARVSADQFVILLEGLLEQDEATAVAETVLSVLKEPIHVNGHDINTTASIGIAIYPDDGADTNMLIKNAGSAMQLAKEEGKNGYRYCTQSLTDELHERLSIEHELSYALAKEEFSLVFQPQYDLRTQKVIAAEVLLRWDQHDRDVISPDRFIPIAEESGTILDIGSWVFVNACKEFLKWRSLGLGLDQIAINVSTVQFNQDDVVEHFKEMIESVGIEAAFVEIEITERYVMEQTERNQNILEELRKIGFKISIDDFGTGYSSMNYLKVLPLDTIKIDKTFVEQLPHDPDDVAISKTIIALAKSLDYTVIAEGIESSEQEMFLREQKCDIGQGDLLSKPLSSEAFITFVQGHKEKMVA